MEQQLNCNVQDCGLQLTGQAVVTVCSHAICLQCANSHGLAAQQGPYTCPVCRGPLNASEICEQLLDPSEEWKSIALSGLSPTVVMECAGRALTFWSYQTANQISYQVRRNAKLKDYCAELQGEIENVWSQANQRITSLTQKIRDMEVEEHSVKRRYEQLRVALENRTKELSQSQELYSKLKQRVLLSQNLEVPPSVSKSRTPMRAAGDADPNHGQSHSQLPRPVASVGARGGPPEYFPASPKYAKTQPNSTTLMEWNKPTSSQQIPVTPSGNLQLRNPTSLAFASTPGSGLGTNTAGPGSGRFPRTVSGPPLGGKDGAMGFSGPKTGVVGLRQSFDGVGLEVPRSLVRTAAPPGLSRFSPRSREAHASQHFQPPGQVIRRP